ncbi:hypothetical protein KTO58_08180 [Chitinophaga pendula]|uniref:hypothetical protein n=1 Tax=Chitinophaga TaxID=79328 RepID=UPI0012FE0895|nr:MULTISPECIES: hypothetical protein [Chitinophaga]UCJ09149.1 hypothetical protein KTO58_08180 [Chitinophaga pendula]
MKKKTTAKLSLKKIKIARLNQSAFSGPGPITDSIAICTTVCSHHENCTSLQPQGPEIM